MFHVKQLQSMLMPRLKTLPPRLAPAPAPRIKTLSRTERITGTTLQNIRRRFLRDHPACAMCAADGITRAATEIDHIIPLSDGGPESDGNRQGLCSEHHAKKSAEEAKRRAVF